VHKLSQREIKRREQSTRLLISKECNVYLSADIRGNLRPSVDKANILVVNDKREHSVLCEYIQHNFYPRRLTVPELETVRLVVKDFTGSFRNT